MNDKMPDTTTPTNVYGSTKNVKMQRRPVKNDDMEIWDPRRSNPVDGALSLDRVLSVGSLFDLVGYLLGQSIYG